MASSASSSAASPRGLFQEKAFHNNSTGPAVLRENISLGLEPGIVLGNLEETASMEEGLLHHEGRVELVEDLG